jgi:hypothetical protein
MAPLNPLLVRKQLNLSAQSLNLIMAAEPAASAQIGLIALLA